MKLRIKEILKEKGMSQVMLAEKLGMTPVALTKRINGYSQCTTEFLQQVAEVLDISIVSLIDDETSHVVSTFCIDNKTFEVREVKKL